MPHDDVQAEVVAITRQRPSAAMLHLRVDGFGVAKLAILARTRVHRTLVAMRSRLQRRQCRHLHVKTEICRLRGAVEADRAGVKRCEDCVLPRISGIQRH